MNKIDGSWGCPVTATHAQAHGGPAGAVAMPATTVVGGADGAEVSVAVQPGARDGHPVVLLRVSSPLLEAVAGAYLGPEEAGRLAAALSAAASAARAPAAPAPAPPAPGLPLRAWPGTPQDGHDWAVSGYRAGPVPAGAGGGAGVRPVVVAVPGYAGHTEVTAVEGTSAVELADAIGLLPAGTILIDFSADADVCLIFGPPSPLGRRGFPEFPEADGPHLAPAMATSQP